jgi:GNAT superfamily N-acetyltransferase
MSDFRIRLAQPNEADALTALCIRSKAHWGYDNEFIRASIPSLTITGSMIETGNVFVAQGSRGNIVGVATVAKVDDGGKFDLSRLFIEPTAIKTGVGRALFEAVAGFVKSESGTRLSILSDPFAEAFYRRLGAVRVGDAPSDTIAGRSLPLLEYVIAR